MQSFPHAAILNHSCCPNAIMRYRLCKSRSPILECIALKDSRMGEECFHSYVDLTYSDEMRKRHLRTNYDFNCTCRRCDREGLDSQALLKTERDAIRALAFDPLSLKNMLEERITDVGLQQGICESLAVSIAEDLHILAWLVSEKKAP